MSEPLDLSAVIETAIDNSDLQDDVTPETPEVEVEATPTDAPTEPLEASTEDSEESSQVTTPATPQAPVAPLTPVDEAFNKKHGIQAQGPTGRENRIPYSRVKKIADNAVKEALDPITKERDDYKTKAVEYETKVTDYEGRLTQVAEFERVMVQEPEKFLQMIATIPAYRQIFSKLAQLDEAPPQAPVQPVVDDMPQPDQELSDGSRVYSQDGLKALLDWQDARTTQKVTKDVVSQFDQRIAPFEQERKVLERERQAQEHLNRVIPQVQAQISDARTWPLFTDSEDEIVAALQRDRNLSLEGAYRKVVFPKIQADRDKMRSSILDEIQKAPASTAAPVRAVRPASPSDSGPRDLESIIREQIKSLK